MHGTFDRLKMCARVLHFAANDDAAAGADTDENAAGLLQCSRERERFNYISLGDARP